MRVNIRCCCTPRLVLGTVEVPQDRLWVGDTIRFALPPSIDVWPVLQTTQGQAAEILRLRVDLAADGTRRELALQSHDTPLETLRRIPSFVEVNYPVPIGGAP